MARVTREVRDTANRLAAELGVTDIWLRDGDELYGVAKDGRAVALADYSESSLRLGLVTLKEIGDSLT